MIECEARALPRRVNAVTRQTPDQLGGFSLIELVFVIVILGIILAIARPQSLPPEPATIQVQAERLANDLRRAQLLATVRRESLCFTASGGGYKVVPKNACLGATLLASLSAPCKGSGDPSYPAICDPATNFPLYTELENGVTISLSRVMFDSHGRPFNVDTDTPFSASSIARFSLQPQATAADGTKKYWDVDVSPTTGHVKISSQSR